MRFLRLYIALFAITTAPFDAAGQNLSLGIVAGGSLTDGFQTENSPAGVHFFSTAKDYLVGPTIEWHFNPRWSIEADGLFRELHLALAQIGSNGGLGSTNPQPVVTWEFPVLAKYRLGSSRARPFIEAGASFRTTGNLNGTNPSHYGFTAGAGVEMKAMKLNFAPVLRYTLWADDSGISPYQAKSSPNQLELAVGVSNTRESNLHPLGMHISLGVLVGAGLTQDTRGYGFVETSGIQSFSETTTPHRGLIGGPMLELQLPASFSVEADAIYRPLRSTTVTTNNGVPLPAYSFSLANWDLPLLAKRRFHTPFGNPFIEGGPAFRLGNGDLSHYGLAAGLGFETHFRAIKIAPTLRYSHWAADNNYGSSDSIRNRLDFLAAFSL